MTETGTATLPSTPSSLIVVDSLDHIVLTVADSDATCAFYGSLLGMRVAHFGENRTALEFGSQRIHLQREGETVAPAAGWPTPGSADLCLLTSSPIEALIVALHAADVILEQGPVERDGAAGRLLSVYFRDPDGNLIEVSNLLDE